MRWWWVIALVFAVGVPAAATASNSQISQQINELNCTLTSTSNGSGTVVAPGCSAQRPVVVSTSPNNGRPIVRGLFDAAFGPNLRVRVAGVWYRLGIDPELTISGNTWVLDLSGRSTPLPAGEYEVRAEHTLANGKVLVDTTSDELIVPEIQVVAPTVNETEWVGGQPVVTGTYDEAQTTELAVTINGQTYVLVKNSELSARGGKWRLDLRQLSPSLAAGKYDVIAEATFKDGSVLRDTSTNELKILPVSIGNVITHPLANTGASVVLPVLVAIILMMVGGGWLVYLRYRRKNSDHA